MCALRNDEWGNEVDLRLQGAISDLPAADCSPTMKAAELSLWHPDPYNQRQTKPQRAQIVHL